MTSEKTEKSLCLELLGDLEPEGTKLHRALMCHELKTLLADVEKKLAEHEDALAALCYSGELIEIGDGQAVVISNQMDLVIEDAPALKEALGDELFGEFVSQQIVYHPTISFICLVSDADHPKQDEIRKAVNVLSDGKRIGYISFTPIE